jgi:hypothetical protein
MDYLVLYIIGGIAALCLFSWVREKYRKVRNKRRQKKLDEIAHDILADFDFNKEKEEIKSIGIRYVSKEYRCPRCGGMLVMRNGRYGRFWGCNHYPECKYTRSVENGLLRGKEKGTY